MISNHLIDISITGVVQARTLIVSKDTSEIQRAYTICIFCRPRRERTNASADRRVAVAHKRRAGGITHSSRAI